MAKSRPIRDKLLLGGLLVGVMVAMLMTRPPPRLSEPSS